MSTAVETDAVMTVGLDFVVKTWSSGAAALYGWSSDEVVGRPVWEALGAPVSAAACDALLQRLIHDGDTLQFEAERTRRDGSRFRADLSLVLVRNDDHSPRELIAVSRDASAREARQHAALREARLAGLTHRMNEIEFIFGADLHVLDANDMALRAYGYARDEFKRLTIRDLRVEADWRIVEDQMRRSRAGGVRFQAVHRRKDGSTFPVEVSSRSFIIDGEEYLHSLVRDLTEQRATERERAALQEQVERSERRYRALFEHLGAELSVFDVTQDADGTWDWSLESSNAVGRRWFNGRYEQVRGKPLRKLLGDGPMKAHMDRTAAILGGETCETEQHFPSRNRWYQSASFAIDERTVVASAFDITELRETQRELEEATHAAQHANELKSQFLANMSHEIRTPLGAVLGLTQLGLDESSPEKVREYLQLIQRSGTGLLELINDILDFSKIEAGRLTIERTPFRLRRLLQDIHDTLEPAADSRGLALVLSLAPGVPEIAAGDPLRVRQVITNLVSNALKFTERGRVDLVADLDATGAVRVTVRDTGVGISPEAAARLFQNFMQADASTTRRFGGTGLGLAISRQLAQLMGGDLRHQPEPRQGATFVFDSALKAASPEEVAALADVGTRATTPPAALAGRRVLLVEDNKINQLLATTLLRKASMEVTVASDGQQGLDVLLGNPAHFDVVLMDVQMPVMDGLEAARLARQHLGPRCPPIVAMTANALPIDRERSAAAGMQAHLTKPIDVAKLYGLLVELLGA